MLKYSKDKTNPIFLESRFKVGQQIKLNDRLLGAIQDIKYGKPKEFENAPPSFWYKTEGSADWLNEEYAEPVKKG